MTGRHLVATSLIIGLFSLVACNSPTRTVQTWTTPDGTPVSPSIIRLQTGASHCDWERVWFLSVGSPIGTEFQSVLNNAMQFVQDLNGVIPITRLESEFEVDAELPVDAEFTGYVTDDTELWVSEAQIDMAVYMIRGSNVEKWPRADPPIFCD